MKQVSILHTDTSALVSDEDASHLEELRARGVRIYYEQSEKAVRIAGKGIVAQTLQRYIASRMVGRPMTRSDFVRRLNQDKFDLRRENIKVSTTIEKQEVPATAPRIRRVKEVYIYIRGPVEQSAQAAMAH